MALTKVSFSMIKGAYVNVLDFGADPTGILDSTAAIQAAINKAGGSIFFPAGDYLVQSQLKLPNYEFYDDNPGQVIFGEGAQILVGSAQPIFTNDKAVSPTGYTSKWTFRNLSFLGVSATSRVFDLDRIYNSVYTQCVFENLTSPFYSRVDRNNDPAYPEGYIQSAVISECHFAQCVKCVDAKKAYGLKVVNNFFEVNDCAVSVDGLSDPACSQIVITGNVMEGGGTQLVLGGIFGGTIQGNYFESNPSASGCDVNLAVSGASSHRGLVISSNIFQPTTTQKADTSFYNVKIAGVLARGQAPVFLGNATSGPRLISGLTNVEALASGNFDAIGDLVLEQFPIPGQDALVLTKIKTGFSNNRATAFDGTNTWKVFNISSVTQSGIYTVDGFLNLYNIGGNLLGRTAISMKIRVQVDAQNVVTAALIGTLDLEELTGARNSTGDPMYAAYWGSVTPSFTISGSTITVNFDAFNDHSVAGLGQVYSLGPSLGFSVSQNGLGFNLATITLP